MRINRYIASTGLCSRRGADRLIEKGLVTINGRIAVAGDRAEPGDEILVEGRSLPAPASKLILAYNKPPGVVCSAVSQGRDEVNIIDAIGRPERLFTVGRLDKPSRGLILLTNDGDLADEIMRASSGHEKEYEVTLDREVTSDFVDAMSQGVKISFEDGSDYVTRPCRVWKISGCTFGIVLTEGKNRQIRRMCSSLGYEVRDLVRVRIMDIKLGDLPRGEYREISPVSIGMAADQNE